MNKVICKLFETTKSPQQIWGDEKVSNESFYLNDVEQVLLEQTNEDFSRIVVVLKLKDNRYSSIIYDEEESVALCYVSDDFEKIIKLGLGQKERIELSVCSECKTQKEKNNKL